MRQKRLALWLLSLGLLAGPALHFGPGLVDAAPYHVVAWQAKTGRFNSGFAVERQVMVPMRDGVRLATDLYRPRAPGPFPVVLIRLPYGRQEIGRFMGGFFARYGYLVVVQDVRGRYDSEGDFYPWRHEQEDGQDTVRWVAAQPWCNQRIGTLGASYFGYTQWALAPDNPQVTALLPVFASSNVYDAHYRGGAFFQMSSLTWALDNRGRQGQSVEAEALQRGFAHLPLIEGDEAALAEVAFYDDWLSHPSPDDYWAAIDMTRWIPAISAPIFLVAGWYDIFNQPQLKDWEAIHKYGRPRVQAESKLLIGPWNHTFVNSHQQEYGIKRPLFVLPWEMVGDWKLWFDYALKGKANGWNERAPVRLYVLGENVWRDEQEWPLARTVYTDYCLHSQGRANTAGGDGRLDPDPPAGDQPPDRFVYDPLDPVPTLGGANLDAERAGPADQRPLEAREDVLVFTSAPLAEALEVTGPIRLTLYASSDAPDTDWTAKLVDVFPDGRALLLCDGILRARYRQGLDKPELLEPGAVYEFEIAVGNTSVLFRPGHRIRLEVSSSNYPRFNRNPNTGTDVANETQTRPARQTVYHDAERPSRLTLPVIPR